MTRLALIAIAGASLNSTAAAQTLSMALDHSDWVYRVGEAAEWKLTSTRDVRVVLLFTYEQQRLRPLTQDTLGLRAGRLHTVKRTLTHPGLLRAVVRTLDAADTAIATAAVGAVRAGDFIFSLPQFDKQTYVVRGGSQGGGLAIMTAALDPRVIAFASDYPAMSDHFGYLKGPVGGWPHIFADTLVKAKAEKMATLPYYDVANFARLLRVPGFFVWGFNDPVVPPHSMYAAYNVIVSPKQLRVHPPAVHGATAEQRRAEEAWLREKLGVK